MADQSKDLTGSGLTSSARHRSRYWPTLVILGLAASFPFLLLYLNPDLMLRRGWEQFLGTGLYWTAVGFLGIELYRSWREEQALGLASGWLTGPGGIPGDDSRILPDRLRQLAAQVELEAADTPVALLELSRESSALDQERASGRFTLQRYILYILPVIGFIGTVEGISKSLMSISEVLPMIEDLPGFMKNLTNVTASLQIAFDSTLLALFLSGFLLLALTMVQRRSEVLLGEVDGFVIGHAIPHFAEKARKAQGSDRAASSMEAAISRLESTFGTFGDELGRRVEQLGAILAGVEQSTTALDRCGSALVPLTDRADSLAELGASIASRLGVLDEIKTLIRETIAASRGDRVATADSYERIRGTIEKVGTVQAASMDRLIRLQDEQLTEVLTGLRDSIDLLQVGSEQGNALYRMIVNKLIGTPRIAGTPEANAA